MVNSEALGRVLTPALSPRSLQGEGAKPASAATLFSEPNFHDDLAFASPLLGEGNAAWGNRSTRNSQFLAGNRVPRYREEELRTSKSEVRARSLRRPGMIEVRNIPADPWAPGAVPLKPNPLPGGEGVRQSDGRVRGPAFA